jgi:hypothetical protein
MVFQSAAAPSMTMGTLGVGPFPSSPPLPLGSSGVGQAVRKTASTQSEITSKKVEINFRETTPLVCLFVCLFGVVPIVIDGAAADWNTIENSDGDVVIIGYTGADKNTITSIIMPTTVNGKKVVKITGTTTTGGIFGQKDVSKNTTITSVDMFNATYLKIIDKYAFSYMTNLTSVIFPDTSLESIERDAFDGSGLISITIPSSVRTIGNYAFRDNAITSLIVPSSVTIIGGEAFKNNPITSLMISEGLTTIRGEAFRNNKKLVSGNITLVKFVL